MNLLNANINSQLKAPVCNLCQLKEFSLFQECSTDLINAVFSNKEFREFKKDEILVKQGDSLKGVFCIQKGSVKVLKEGGNNKKLILWFAKPGDVIGVDAFISNENYSYTAFAIEPVSACFIPEIDFQKLVSKEPGMARKLMKDMCSRINFIEDRITSISGKKVREQFAEMLISIAMKNKDFVSGSTPINYSIKDLANIIGTTNNYLYKILSDFNSKNLVSIQNKKLVIKDFDKLSLIAIGDETSA